MKIGLIAALFEESVKVYEKLGALVRVEKDGSFEVRVYSYSNHELYLATSGVGEIHAALAAQYLIMKFGVRLIVNFGVVGSLTPKLHAGDVVIANEVVHYDFSAGANDLSNYGYYLDCDTFVNVVDTEFFDSFSALAGIGRVRIASADKFVNSTELKNWIKKSFDCQICDMESAGINFAAKAHGVPLLLIKSISDNADESADTDFETVVSTGVNFYVDTIHSLLNSL